MGLIDLCFKELLQLNGVLWNKTEQKSDPTTTKTATLGSIADISNTEAYS